MQIKIVSLRLRNFKGTPDATYRFDVRDANVYGDNKTGKTTIADAWFWILFDKSSLGVTAFDMKPVGLVKPEVEVTLVLSVDGKEIELKKTLTEKWTKKRGEEFETLTGHESRFWINQIERKQTDYKAFLDSIISEKDFRMLTSADYFLSLKKPEMRAILVSMAGGVSDMDIAGTDAQLVSLVQLMQDKGYSSDDLLKLCKQNIALYNTEQMNIGPRIDEVRRMTPQEADYGQLEAGLTTARDYVSQIDERLSSSRKAASEANRKHLDTVVLKNKIDAYARTKIEEANKEFFARKIRIQQAASAIQTAQAKISPATIEALTMQLNERKAMHEALKEEYIQLFAERKAEVEKEMEQLSDDALMCDKCGQPLPAEKIEIVKDQALRSYNTWKVAKLSTMDKGLDAVVAKGQTAKDMIKAIEDRLAKAVEAQEIAKREVELAKQYYLEISTAEAQQEPIKEIDLTGDLAYEQMAEELKALEASIVTPEDKTDSLLASKAKLESQIQEIQKRLNGREERTKGLARIEELTARGQTLSGLIAFEKSRQFQVERFIRAKAERLESSINAMFENISFRLFDIQINGAIVDDCTPLVHNVDYKDASHSEQIRAGLDLVSAFQKNQDKYAPVFVDNAEAATYLRKMDCQLIRLVVSKDDKWLRVERIKRWIDDQVYEAY